MNQKTLPKTLGVFALVMINVVAVDSLRTLPFSADFGFSLVFYYILGAIMFFLPAALVSAELATGWPDKGGVYVWVREAFGERWSFLIIWLQWIYNIVWYPTILSFVAGAIAYLFEPALASNRFYMLAMVLGIFYLATLVNLFGMKASSVLSAVGALAGAIIPMGVMIFLGAVWLFQGKPIQVDFSWSSFFPDISSLKNIVFLTAILFGLIGMELSATHADEVRDPGRAYPKAIFYSTIIVFVTLVFSSLSIAMVVPHTTLNVVTGVEQAFRLFFEAFRLSWMEPVVVLLVIVGGIGTVAAWIIGPTKGLMVATRDGSAPGIFAKETRRGVPIVILFLQAFIFTLLCSVFLLMPTVAGSYWVLTAMTAQLAMLVYVGMFAAVIYLRYKKPDVKRAFQIPLGRFGVWAVGLLGICASVFAIALGFVPPKQIEIGSLWVYEGVLILGIIILSAPPFVMYQFQKKRSLG